MTILEQLYTTGFFAEWGSGNRTYVDSAVGIAAKIHALFRPRTVADLGCGSGVYSDTFQKLGARTLSIDGVLPPKEYAFPIKIEVADLSEPFLNPWGKFDLAVCFEVGEHIEPEKADIFLKNIIQFSDRILLSCAPPGQGGHGHVNEQSKRYWVKKMAENGFLYDRPATGKLQESFRVDPPQYVWMASQISVYEKAGAFGAIKRNMPFKLRYKNT
jgi:hypothetical protein